MLIKIDESVFLKKYQRELASGNSNVTSHLIALSDAVQKNKRNLLVIFP